MKIYFVGSIQAGRQDAHIYIKIVEFLRKRGTVLTEHVADANHDDMKTLTPKQIFDRDVAWLTESDVVVGEVTVPSLGVGYEVGIAEKLGKKVVLMHRKGSDKRLSPMLSGNPHYKIIEYEELDEGLKGLEKEL